MAESPGSEKRQNAERELRESASDSRDQEAGVSMDPRSRFGEDERRRLAEFFSLLDRMDRAKARGERKVA
jgi:hypothetical protein